MPDEDSATPPLPDSRGTTTQWAGLHRMKGLLSPPTLSPAFNVEASIHKPPRMLRRDIELVFRPDLAAAHTREAAEGQSLDEYLAERLIAVPTWQPSKHDLSEMSFVVNEERRGLLLNFHAWVKGVRARLGDWWSDASDPLEGTALFGARTSCIYNELEGLTSLLRYDSIPIGCCGIVLHPAWQRRAYPVTFFTTAPLEVLQAAIAGAEAERAAALAAEGGTERPVPEAAIVPAAAAAGVMEAKVAAAQAAQAAAAVQAAAAAVEGLQLADAEQEQACALPRGRAKSDADLLELDSEEAADGDLTILGGETLSWLQGAPPLRLRTSAQVHFDPLNIPLLDALPGAVRAGDAVLYPGCGSGLLGLLALRSGAASVHFTDSDAAAVDLTAGNARVAGFREGRNWTAQVSDLRSSLVDAPQYDLILANPPQLAGPPALAEARPDRYAGPEGVQYYAALARLANTALKPAGRVALLQTSLSSFAAVEALFAPRQPTTLAAQPRTMSAAALEALAPGALSWLLALRARGASDFELRDAAGTVLPPAGAGVAAQPSAAELAASLHFTQRLVAFG